MTFWRHLGALLRKNYLLKRRSPISTFLEILIPVSIALLLAGVKSIIPPDVSPVTAFTSYGRDISTVPSMRDAPLLLQAQRKKLAIVGPPSLVDPFIAWLNATYPAIDGRTFGGGFNHSRLRDIRLPGMADVITTAFRTEDELASWLRSAEYPGNDPFPSSPAARGRVWAAVVLQEGAPHWKYSIRMNASEVPSTRPPYIDTLDRQGVRYHLWKYLYANPVQTSDTPLGQQSWGDGSSLQTRAVPGFMALQQTLDKYILNMPMRVSSLTLNDYSSKIGGAFWNVLGQDSNILWDDVWDQDGSRGINKTAMLEDMIAYGQAERYYPHETAVAPFPTSAYTSQPFYTASQYSAPMIFVLALLVPIAGLLKAIVLEKESKLRESMRMMGLSDASLQAAWLITAEVQLLLIALLVALILSFPMAGGGDASKAMFPGSGFLPVFSLFALFGTASVAYANWISTLFSSARTASTVGSLLYFGAFFPFYATGTTDSLVAREGKVAACLLPPTCFAQSLSHLMAIEGAGSTLTLYGPGANGHVPLRNFAFVDGLAMLAASVVGFALLAAYTDAVLPYPLRQYGTPRPWYYPLTDTAQALAACCACRGRGAGAQEKQVLSATAPGKQPASNCLDIRNPLCAAGAPAPVAGPGRSTVSQSAGSSEKGGHRPRADSATGACEAPDAYLQARAAAGECIELQDISKVFTRADGSSHRAVDDMSLTLYSGHISVLLGHNGAGKSTLINILAGLMPSSGGALRAWGHDLGGDFQALRADMGVCPQHDVLWPQLTAQEHIQLFAAIKGLELGPTGVQEALDEVGLLGKAAAAASTLSGGQKRKLSLAIALLGRAKLLLLDEPTSGMDPYSRRSTWDLLQKVKAGRVIILTTHFMDEADILGDRIAIMAAGKLHSVGTPIYLKEAFGVGYNLTVVMPPEDATSPATSASASTTLLHSAILSALPSALHTSAAGREVHYSLPLAAAPSFPALLRTLDALRAGTGVCRIESYSLGVTTMEDVFLQVAHTGGAGGKGKAHAGDALQDKAKEPGGVEKEFSKDALTSVAPSSKAGAGAGAEGSSSAYPPPPPPSTFSSQLRALLIKRALYARRDARGMCLQLLLPVVTVVLGLALLQVGKWLAGDQPPLPMRPHFNTDPGNPTGPPVYPNRVPALNYKATDIGGVESPELASLLSSLSSVDPLQWDSVGPGLTLPPSLMDALPDTYGLRAGVAANEGPNNNGWPSHAFAAMSALLIARQECVLKQGRAYSALLAQDPSGGLVDRVAGVRDGASVYGALLFMLNGTQYGGWQPKHDVSTSWFSGYSDMLNVSHGWGLADGPSLVGWGNQDSAPQPVLAYGLMVNVTAIHAAPILANQVHNALYRLRLSMDAAAASLAASPSCAGQGLTAGCPLNLSLVTQQASGSAAVSGLGSISITAHPLPYTVREEASTSALFSFGAAAIVTIAFAFIPAAHALYVAKERECGAKQQQELSGLSVPAYWASNYLYDVTFYLLPAAACLAAGWGFRLKEFTGSDGQRDAAFIGLVLLYGLAAPPFAYLLSFAFKSSSSAQSAVLFLSISAVLLIIGTMIMGQLPATCEAEGKLRYALMLMPGYSLGNGLVRLSFLSVQPVIDAMCAVHINPRADYASLAKRTYTATQGDVAGWNMLALGVQAVVYGLLVLLVDAHRAGVLQWRVSLPGTGTHAGAASALAARPPPLQEEEDVREERGRVEGMVVQNGKSSHPILLHRLRKVYSAAPKEASSASGGGAGASSFWLAKACPCCRRKGKKVQVAAVKDLSFHVPAGEVFGFLGVNGAGKTTTMQMLTGAEVPTLGQAWLQGHDVVRERGSLRRQLGYCPQTDPLVELLTVREQLELYARLKGLPEPGVQALVPSLMARMELHPFAHTLSGSLSGGNKRKLCVAMALIGSPSILFLDEPSTGMDPVAKRVVWGAVRQAAVTGGAACMLTTHSMEEAEALATRIGIMVAGELRCLGTAGSLKSKLGQGYQLQLQLGAPTEAETEGVARAVKECLSLPGDSSADTGLQEAQIVATVTALLGPGHVEEALSALVKGHKGRRAAGNSKGEEKGDKGGARQAIAVPGTGTATVHPTSSARKLLAAAGGNGPSPASQATPPTTLSALTTWLAVERTVQGAVDIFTKGLPSQWCGAEEVARAEGASSAFTCFAGGRVLERHGLSLRVHVPLQPTVSLAALFAACEAWKGVARVVSYGLSEATFEQVFNTFAGGSGGGKAADGQQAKGTGGPMVNPVAAGSEGSPAPSPTNRLPVGRGTRRASLT